MVNFDSPWINIINVPEVSPCGLEPWEHMDNEVSVYFVLSERDRKEDCSKSFVWKENLLIQNCIKECVSKHPRFEMGRWTSLSHCPPFKISKSGLWLRWWTERNKKEVFGYYCIQATKANDLNEVFLLIRCRTTQQTLDHLFLLW